MKTLKTRKWEVIQRDSEGIGNGANLPTRFLENALDTETMPYDLHSSQTGTNYSDHDLLRLVEQALQEMNDEEEIEDEALNHIWKGIAKAGDDLEHPSLALSRPRGRFTKKSVRSSPSCPIPWD